MLIHKKLKSLIKVLLKLMSLILEKDEILNIYPNVIILIIRFKTSDLIFEVKFGITIKGLNLLTSDPRRVVV